MNIALARPGVVISNMMRFMASTSSGACTVKVVEAYWRWLDWGAAVNRLCAHSTCQPAGASARR